MSEVKSALLHEYEGEHGTLIMVDEDYQIHAMTSDEGHLREILDLLGANLPNFRLHRLIGEPGNMRVLEKGDGRGEYYDPAEAIKLLHKYSDPSQVPGEEAGAQSKGWFEQLRDRMADPADPLYESKDVADLIDVIERQDESNNRLRYLLRV